ncbi:histidine utilization repressor [Rhodoligotrophos defluvii]|uniref:histidine utilization repressor n=1 Tax=Rhodoligotrophos defluvii TaxID=2561934 RepID=UPI0010CA1513|nr:histidine utilization repressor [Rhodoligotrophos defluvii]
MTKVEAAEREPEAATLHQKIAGEIRGKILSGEWPVGYRLPIEVDLAREYRVSRMTINKVLTQLARAGLIERVKKGGTFVSQPHTQSAVLEIGDIRREVESLKLPYAFRLMKAERRRATSADLALLDVSAGAPLLEVVCVHTAGGRPFCLEQRLINLVTVPDAASVEFKDVSPSQWLLSQIPWTSAEHRIHAAAAAGDDAVALEIAEGTACLVIERRTWGGSGPVTHVRLTYPGDRHTLIATFTPAS